MPATHITSPSKCDGEPRFGEGAAPEPVSGVSRDASYRDEDSHSLRNGLWSEGGRHLL